MGMTDKLIIPVYKGMSKNIPDEGVVGMFGFTRTDKISKLWKRKDYYDLRLSNWDINASDWCIKRRYQTIVCLRTSGFAEDPARLLHQFHERLEDNGILMIDWSMGSGHYPRKTNGTTFGWEFRGKRSYGEYNKQKCHLFSSCLTDECVKSSAFRDLCKHAKKEKHYKSVKSWEQQVVCEFDPSQLLRTNDILELYDILYEVNWTPLGKNGRFQLYTIQILRK